MGVWPVERARGGLMPRHQRGQQSPWTSAGVGGWHHGTSGMVQNVVWCMHSSVSTLCAWWMRNLRPSISRHLTEKRMSDAPPALKVKRPVALSCRRRARGGARAGCRRTAGPGPRSGRSGASTVQSDGAGASGFCIFPACAVGACPALSVLSPVSVRRSTGKDYHYAVLGPGGCGA